MTRTNNGPIDRSEYYSIKHYLDVSSRKEGLSMETRASVCGRDISTLYRIRRSRNFRDYRRMLKESRGEQVRNRVSLLAIALAFIVAWVIIGYTLRGLVR